MYEAVKVALDPTPAQERMLLSHAGAARFAYNAALAHVKEAIEADKKPEWSFYSLRKWWNANRDELAVDDDGVIWWADNSKEAYSYGLESLAKGLLNWSKSRRGASAEAIAWASQSSRPRARSLQGSRTQLAFLDSFRMIIRH